jgi:hypothetical protein
VLCHPIITVAAQLRGQDGHKLPVSIALSHPHGQPVMRIDGEIVIGAGGGAFLQFQMMNVVFPESGNYSVTIESQGAVLATQVLRLRLGAGVKAA